MFSCYNNGIEWLNTILHQDVYQIEPWNVKGRHARNIVSHKLQDLQIVKKNNKEKKKAKVGSNNNNNDNNNNNNNNNNEESSTTKKYRKISENEKSILEKILHYNTFPENKALNVFNQLEEESTGWDLNHIKTYWKITIMQKKVNN